MTDRQPAQTLLAARALRARPARWTWLRAGCLFLALNSGASAQFALYTTENVDGTSCDVIGGRYIGQTTKEGALFPKDSEVKSVLVECPGKPSPIKRSVIVIDHPSLERRLVLTPTQFTISLAFAPDPFDVGMYESTGSALKPYHAYRFNLDTKEFQDLGAFGGPTGTSSAFGVNFDGSVVVGASNLTTAGASVSQAFRWTQALGMKNLGAIAPDSYSQAHATSQDGSVVVGMTYVPGTGLGNFNEERAFRWVLSNPVSGAGTMTDLGPATSTALAVNGDGTVIVGRGKGMRAFRWTQAGGVVDLGVLPGHSRSVATAVSADGQVVVGISSSDFILSPFPDPGPSYDETTSRAFRWTQSTGMRDLNTLLAAAGHDLTGITLVAALGLSADGQSIVGAGLSTGADATSGFSARYVDAGAPAPAVSVIEFYNAALDHYFIAYAADEIAKLDNGTFKGWARTGLSFKAYVESQSGTAAVCRIYIPPGKGDGHFFGRDKSECDGTMSKNPTFILESAAFLQLYPPTLGICAAGQVPVYRAYSNRADANHRYTTSRVVRDQMVGKGWLAEGDGPDIVVMCAPS